MVELPDPQFAMRFAGGIGVFPDELWSRLLYLRALGPDWLIVRPPPEQAQRD
jgi:hypothetical protein